VRVYMGKGDGIKCQPEETVLCLKSLRSATGENGAGQQGAGIQLWGRVLPNAKNPKKGEERVEGIVYLLVTSRKKNSGHMGEGRKRWWQMPLLILKT